MTPGSETVVGIEELTRGLDDAARASGVEQITAKVKSHLEGLTQRAAICLPACFLEAGPESYARRLVHRNEELGYTVVAMTWGPGQGTTLHDHAGMWCVECVVRGDLWVTQYDLAEQRDGAYRFDKQSRVRAAVGDAGALIPPFEYHTLNNACDRNCAITLHVYGGEMEQCNLYHQRPDGWWEKSAKQLSYGT